MPAGKKHLPVSAVNFNPQIERAIVDILLDTILSERYVFITAESNTFIQRKHIINCGILLVNAGIGALRSNTEFLGKAIEICGNLAIRLRNVDGQFAEVCKGLAGQLDRLALYFKNVIRNFEFIEKTIIQRAAHLNQLKDHYLDLKDPAFLKEFQIFKKLCHVPQAQAPWQSLGNILSSSNMGPVIGAAMSMCIEDTATTALDLVMTYLKPSIDSRVKASVRTRVIKEPRLELIQKKDIDERLLLLFEISLYEDLQDILKQIALGAMRHSEDWRIQLLTLSVESILTLQAICVCTDQVCDNFFANLPIPKKHSGTDVYSIEELTHLISTPISQILYNKILILMGRVVAIIPQALYKRYQENKERERDQKEIEFIAQRLEHVDAADRKAAEANCRCVHDAVAETLGLNSKQLADASGLGAPERGAFKTDIRRLYRENGIETQQCGLKEAFDILQRYDSDRGIACFEDPDGAGHAVAFYCEEGQLIIRDRENKIRLDDYKQQYGYFSVELIIPTEVNIHTLSAIQQTVNFNRITRAPDSMTLVYESENEAFRLGMPRPKPKKNSAEQDQIDPAIKIDQGAVPTAAQRLAIIATLVQKDWRLPNVTDQNLDGRSAFRCDHAALKNGYEIQKNNMRGKTTVAVVHYPAELWRMVGTNKELDKEVHDIIKPKLIDSLNNQEKIYLKLEDFPKIFEYRQSKIKHKGASALIARRATQMDYWLDYSKNAFLHLLDFRLQASGISTERIIIMRLCAMNSQQLNETLLEITQCYSHQDYSPILLLPLLIQQSEWVYHWVGIVLEKQGTCIHLNYLDSENQTAPVEFEEAFTQALEAAYPQCQIQFFQLIVESQRYNNCGPELIENFIQYLTGTRVSQEEAIELHQFLGLQEVLLQSCDSAANFSHMIDAEACVVAEDEEEEATVLACVDASLSSERASNTGLFPIFAHSHYSFFSMRKFGFNSVLNLDNLAESNSSAAIVYPSFRSNFSN